MPELPEVETIVRDLNTQKLACTGILRSHVFWNRSIALPKHTRFCDEIRGAQILRFHRHGKLIAADLTGGKTLFIHLRMTGKILIRKEASALPHERVRLDLSDGRFLSFLDTRKFGRWYLTPQPGSILNRLGPEPFGTIFTPAWLEKQLQKHRRRLKPLLLDQSFVAGLGNIYADEALWESRLHPARMSHSLRPDETRDLHTAIRKVLRRGIRNLGTSLGSNATHYYSVGGRRGRNQDALNIFRKTGLPCPRCKKTIQRLVIAQRSTHICPACQPLKKYNSARARRHRLFPGSTPPH